MSRPNKILGGGIGNIFLGDDAFGSEVARRLMDERLPPEVRVIDFGIRAYDLAYLIEPDLNQLEQLDANLADAHSMNPARVLQMLRRFGNSPGKLYLIGCEPAILEAEDGQIGMSETVEKSVPQAIEWVKMLVDDLLKENPMKEVGST
jgi:hydrogenase maturation protease